MTSPTNDNVLAALGLDGLPEAEQKALLERMTDLAESRLMRNVLALLGEEDKQELDRLLAANGDVAGFLKSKIPNLEEMTRDTLVHIKEEIGELGAAIEKKEESSS